MSRLSRGSWFLPSSNEGWDDHSEACKKELLRHHDSTVIYTGVFESGKDLHACAVGVSGIIVHRPVLHTETGQKVKGHIELSVTSMLHEFCKGNVFLLKLLLPHHEAARDQLGAKCDHITPPAYAKTAAFLVNILNNVNMEDSDGMTPLRRLLTLMTDNAKCATPWMSVLEYLISAGAKVKKSSSGLSVVDCILKLSEVESGKKGCVDSCEHALVTFLLQEIVQSGTDLRGLRETVSERNSVVNELMKTLPDKGI